MITSSGRDNCEDKVSTAEILQSGLPQNVTTFGESLKLLGYPKSISLVRALVEMPIKINVKIWVIMFSPLSLATFSSISAFRRPFITVTLCSSNFPWKLLTVADNVCIFVRPAKLKTLTSRTGLFGLRGSGLTGSSQNTRSGSEIFLIHVKKFSFMSSADQSLVSSQSGCWSC